MEEPEGKQCCHCKAVKPLEAFQNDRTTRDGKKSRCKACTTRHRNCNPEAHGEKKCYLCQTVKNYSQFHKDNSSKDGYAYECKQCKKQRMQSYYRREEVRVHSQNYHRGRSRKHPRLKYPSRSGGEITQAEYAAMVQAQNGTCAICGRSETVRGGIALAIDHNHTTGLVRGLLCISCNTGLGKFKDDPRLLRRAAAYLEEYDGDLESEMEVRKEG